MQLTVDSRQLPVGWEIKKLGEVCNISTGKLNANAAVENGKYPFFTCSREIFSIDCFAFDCEAILLAGNNAVGDFNVKHYKGKFNAYQRTYVITINQQELLLYRYLYLQIENNLKDFKLKSVGAGTKFLKLDMIKNLKIHLPPLPEQKQIVAILDEAFEGIDRAIANTEKNLANSRELFESYLNAIFRQKGDDGWEIKQLSEICHVVGGGTPSKSNEEFYTGEISRATVRDMKNEIISQTECRITEEAVKKSSTNIIKQGNVVIATRVGLGKVCMVAQNTAINQDLKGIIPKNNNQILIRFLFWWLKSIAPLIKEEGTGATVQGVKVTFVHALKIPVPLLSEQKEIITQLDEISAETQRLETIYRQKLAALKELKQSILQKAFTGELTADTAKTEKEEIAA